MELSAENPQPLRESSAVALEWPRLRDHIAAKAGSALGRARVQALEPTANLIWIDAQHQRTFEIVHFFETGGAFDFAGLFDPTTLLDQARISGAALAPAEILELLTLLERLTAWRILIATPALRANAPAIVALSAPILQHDLSDLLRALNGKIEPDDSLADDASPDLRRIRRAMADQQRAIESSLRRALRAISDAGSAQDELITVRGERFVIPVKSEFRRKVPGVIHGASSTGQTVFIEPLETIEQNNELVRLLDEEQAEIHRILVALTRLIGEQAAPIAEGTGILADIDSHFARAKFARALNCVRPTFSEHLSLKLARHPLLEIRLKQSGAAIVPLTFELPPDAKQLILSGPNTGGKTVALKTLGLLALIAQAGVPVPAEAAALPLFDAIYADIGDAQSIERNLSTFSAHVTNVNHIARAAGPASLVLLDELGSATDPEEGAALAVAISEHFLHQHAWCFITTHLTSLKVYAAKHAGVVNAAVGFDEQTLAPTYDFRIGVPGASAGINIAQRIGLDPAIVAAARAQLNTQTADIAHFIDNLHAQLAAAEAERADLRHKQQQLTRERLAVEVEGRNEQKLRTRDLEKKLEELIKDFEYQLRETVKAIDDKTVAQKISKESDRRIARLRREFSEQFNSTVVAHVSGADKNDPAAQPHFAKNVKVGDLVKLKSLGKEARVVRLIDAKNFEVSVGQMKMRIPLADIAEVTPVQAITPLEAARKRGGVTMSTNASDSDYVTSSEINVIGQNAEEAWQIVERFVDQAFLAGLPRIRIVHGIGMGILRRTLREELRKHPHVATITEPAHNLGGAGATEVELRQ